MATAAITGPLLRTAGNLLSPAGRGARLAILIFHQVLDRPDPMRPDTPDRARFEQQLDALTEHFRVLPLAEGVERLRRGTLPARAASITFDDGYADNVTVALPLLRRRQLHATFFVTTGFLDGGCMWNDRVIEAVRGAPGPRLDLAGIELGGYSLVESEDRRRSADTLIGLLKYLSTAERAAKVAGLAEACGSSAAPSLMMTREQLRELDAAGMDIGGHTVNHPILARLDRVAARVEMAQGREELEEIVRRRVRLFAYPNGRPRRDYTVEHAQLAREIGFEAAVSTAWGAARAGGDFFQLPRFTPWDRTRMRFVVRLLRNYRQPVVTA